MKNYISLALLTAVTLSTAAAFAADPNPNPTTAPGTQPTTMNGAPEAQTDQLPGSANSSTQSTDMKDKDPTQTGAAEATDEHHNGKHKKGS
jgi:hypothetical protein